MRDVRSESARVNGWRQANVLACPVVPVRAKLPVLSVVLVAALLAAARPLQDAEALLRSKGLHRHEGGNIWVLGLESRLRTHAASLDELRRGVISLQAAVDQRIEQNRLRWEAASARSEVLKVALQTLKKDDPKRKAMEQQIQELRRQAVEPRQLGATPDVQARLVELTNQRQALTLAVLTVRDGVPRLEAEYQRLAQDAAVQAALRQLDGAPRLGPVQPNYRAELRRVSECERVVLTPWIPLYLQSGQLRVGGLVNERHPATFTWKTESQPTVLTASMLEGAGLSVPRDAASTTLAFDRGRQVTARQVTVPAIRFGRHVLTDVPAWVLPPEAEDLGAQIGPPAFADYGVRCEPERLRMVIQSR